MSTTTALPVDVAQPDDAQFAITDLAPTARALVALNSTKTEHDLLAMAAKHVGLVEIKDKVGREQVHGAAMELMRARTAVKKTADAVRDDAKKFNAAVIAEEKRLTALVEAEETRLKALRDAWDAEQERIKREAEEQERARLMALGARIQEIRAFAKLANDCRSSDAVRRLVDRMAGLDMTGFEEFEEEATKVYAETRQQVENALNTRLATEAEVARLKAEREELERQQAEAKRQADELAAKQKAEADKLAADRAEFARQQQEAADKLAEQQAEVARMRAEIEVAKATIPAEVAPEKQAMADAVREIAGVGIAIADELLSKPAAVAEGEPMADLVVDVKYTPGDPSTHVPQIEAYKFLMGTDTCCENGPPGGVCEECAEISAGYQAAMAPVRSDLIALPVIQPAMLDADLVDTATHAVASTGATLPSAERLIYAIASAWGTDAETACSWLCARAGDFEAWVPSVADIA